MPQCQCRWLLCHNNPQECVCDAIGLGDVSAIPLDGNTSTICCVFFLVVVLIPGACICIPGKLALARIFVV
eukprot:scaffold855_cov140-Skeletonema_menzelii.AAC.1